MAVLFESHNGNIILGWNIAELDKLLIVGDEESEEKPTSAEAREWLFDGGTDEEDFAPEAYLDALLNEAGEPTTRTHDNPYEALELPATCWEDPSDPSVEMSDDLNLPELDKYLI